MKWVKQKLHLEFHKVFILSSIDEKWSLAFKSNLYGLIFFAPLFIFLYNYLYVFALYKGVGVTIGFYLLALTLLYYFYFVLLLGMKLKNLQASKAIKLDWHQLIWVGTLLLGTLFSLIFYIVGVLT